MVANCQVPNNSTGCTVVLVKIRGALFKSTIESRHIESNYTYDNSIQMTMFLSIVPWNSGNSSHLSAFRQQSITYLFTNIYRTPICRMWAEIRQTADFLQPRGNAMTSRDLFVTSRDQWLTSRLLSTHDHVITRGHAPRTRAPFPERRGARYPPGAL